MVRKQVYIEDQPERRLKTRAKLLGLTEADIIRRSLERGSARSPRCTLTRRPGRGSFVTSKRAGPRPVAAPRRPGRGTTSMPAEVLVDSNVVVYAYDPRDPAKQAQPLVPVTRAHEPPVSRGAPRRDRLETASRPPLTSRSLGNRVGVAFSASDLTGEVTARWPRR